MQQVALLLLLLVGCPSTEEPALCASALEGSASVELGELSGGVYTPLAAGDSLMVHAGIDGGFHHDLAVRLAGEGADQPAVLTIRETLDGGWQETWTLEFSALCQDLDGGSLLHADRFLFTGPGCGDDPCTGPDDQSDECVAFGACVDREEDGFPNTTWEELYGFTAAFEVEVEGFASTSVDPVPLEQGFQVSGGG